MEPAVLQAAAWKRQFFDARDFTCVEDLIHAAANGEQAEVYVRGFLSIAHRPRRRRTVTELYQATQGTVKPHWFTKVSSGLWVVYCAERTMWKDKGVEDCTEMSTASKKQRRMFCGTGLTAARRRPLHTRAANNRSEALRDVAGETFVVWVDNYNKFRYSRNPNEDRDRCINATVFALLPLPAMPSGVWRSWPTPRQLIANIDGFGRQLLQHHKQLNDRARVQLTRNLQYDKSEYLVTYADSALQRCHGFPFKSVLLTSRAPRDSWKRSRRS